MSAANGQSQTRVRSVGVWLRSTSSSAPLGLLTLVAATFLATDVLSTTNVFVFDNVLLASLGAIALTVLIGTAGQVSIGNSAFLAVGAFSAALSLRAGIPFPVDIIIGTVASALIGVVVGLPGLRLRGLELALATLAIFFLAAFLTNEIQIHTSGASGGFTVNTLFGSEGLATGQKYWAWLLAVLLGAVGIGAHLLSQSKAGRAMRIIRDHELIAPTLGVWALSYKLVIFGLTSAVLGLEGALSAHFLGSVTSDNYTLGLAIQYVAMVVIGGLGSIGGAVVGAATITALPTVMTNILPHVLGARLASSDSADIASILYFALLILFLAASPGGVASWGRRLKGSSVKALAKSPFGPEIEDGTTG